MAACLLLWFCEASVQSSHHGCQCTLNRLNNIACMLLQVLAPRGRFSIELYMSYLKLVGQVRALNCFCN